MNRVVGLALDIDGCIIRGSHKIPGVVKALKRLRSRRVPHIYLTNGGGCTEATKAAAVNKVLGEELVLPDQVVLSHTPLRKLVPELRQKRILVTGCSGIADVARSCGFENILSAAEIIKAHPKVWPARSVYHTDPIIPSEAAKEYEPGHQFDAIFIMWDGDCYGSELQILLDALSASRTRDGEHIPVYCTNTDLLYAADYPIPRIGQGAILTCIRAMYEMYFGGTLVPILYGKPTRATYEYAGELLNQQAKELGHQGVDDFWGIGDNPESDINGANLASWNSGLVRTGVFPADLDNDPNYRATKVFDSVVDAINHIMGRKYDGIT